MVDPQKPLLLEKARCKRHIILRTGQFYVILTQARVFREKRALNENNASIRLSYRQACSAFS